MEKSTISDDQQALHMEERAIADIYRARKERRRRILRESVPLFIRNRERIFAELILENGMCRWLSWAGCFACGKSRCFRQNAPSVTKLPIVRAVAGVLFRGQKILQ